MAKRSDYPSASNRPTKFSSEKLRRSHYHNFAPWRAHCKPMFGIEHLKVVANDIGRKKVSMRSPLSCASALMRSTLSSIMPEKPRNAISRDISLRRVGKGHERQPGWRVRANTTNVATTALAVSEDRSAGGINMGSMVGTAPMGENQRSRRSTLIQRPMTMAPIKYGSHPASGRRSEAESKWSAQ